MRMVKHPYLQRIISIGRRNMGVVPVLILLSLAQNGAALAATAPPLGAVQEFGVLGASTVTNTGTTTINGDLGLYSGTSITGFFGTTANEGPGVVTGVVHQTDTVAQNAQADATTAVSAITSQGCTTELTGTDLGTVTLIPGVYCFTSTAQLTGTLNLSGPGVYIFQIGSTLTTAASSDVALNGADSGNVFWQVGTTATLGASSTFRGTIFAGTIGLGAGANLVGRAVAQTGAVTLSTNTVTVPLLLPTLGTVKSVQTYSDPINGVSSPKAIPGSFMLYTILVTNTGPGTVDNNTTVITDPIPANTELFVGDINGAGSGPVLFTDGATASGLSYSFTNLASAADNLSFSNNGATSYVYSPTADANQCDASVTHLKISLGGIFSASDGTNHPSFSIKFRVRVK
ncbi:MAG: ice-binding family protein [Deltaproteobacteria bacterium]|nr:ice-binding family protein [Deltaproteobacteria bacterium]